MYEYDRSPCKTVLKQIIQSISKQNENDTCKRVLSVYRRSKDHLNAYEAYIILELASQNSYAILASTVPNRAYLFD